MAQSISLAMPSVSRGLFRRDAVVVNRPLSGTDPACLGGRGWVGRLGRLLQIRYIYYIVSIWHIRNYFNFCIYIYGLSYLSI